MQPIGVEQRIDVIAYGLAIGDIGVSVGENESAGIFVGDIVAAIGDGT
jgi:hypothetical protein